MTCHRSKLLVQACIVPLLAATLLSACRRKEPVATPASQPSAPAASVAAQEPAAPAPPPAPANEPAPASSEPADNSVDGNLANTYLLDLQSIVDSYVAVTKKKPTDFAQLISAGYLPAVPPAPAGKRYIIDTGAKVKLANR